MVLETERYPGGYHQNNYSVYEGPNGSYSNFQDISQQTTPYSGHNQPPTYRAHALRQHSDLSDSGGYPGNSGSHYPSSGMGGSLKPTYGGYGHSPYGQAPTYQANALQQHSGYGSPYGQNHGGLHGPNNGHGGHEGPQRHGYGSPQGYGLSGFGGGAPNHFNKPTHGPNGYGNGSPYGHGPNGMNNGYQKPTWELKGLEDDDE